MEHSESSEPKPSNPQSSQLSIATAGCLGAMMGISLVLIVIGVLGGGYLMSLVVIAIMPFGLAALHYLVWGWWLGKQIHREDEKNDQQDNGFG